MSATKLPAATYFLCPLFALLCTYWGRSVVVGDTVIFYNKPSSPPVPGGDSRATFLKKPATIYQLTCSVRKIQGMHWTVQCITPQYIISTVSSNLPHCRQNLFPIMHNGWFHTFNYKQSHIRVPSCLQFRLQVHKLSNSQEEILDRLTIGSWCRLDGMYQKCCHRRSFSNHLTSLPMFQATYWNTIHL